MPDELPDTVLKHFGLSRSDIPFIAGKLVYKCKDSARDLSTGLTGTQCG